VYCQLGRTTEKTREKKEYIPVAEILAELKSWLQYNQEEARNLEYITFSGAGEPSLNSGIGRLISEINKVTTIPVAVITNASLLDDPELRGALCEASLLVPSLDAANQAILARIDRPHHEIKVEHIIDGLVNLRKEYTGKIWLEIMLVKGVNDDIRHIRKLKLVIDKINPDKVQLNSPVRTTAERGVLPTDPKKMKKIKEILGDKAEIV
jgi:wyosine [tRNA(Phe)-imidazoG37] synthetase (radical SAM superfamily)